jgi:hypothetical protein
MIDNEVDIFRKKQIEKRQKAMHLMKDELFIMTFD